MTTGLAWTGQPFDGAKIALLHGEQVLALKRDDTPAIPFPGLWDLPGGAREGDETPVSCAVREVEEELGIALGPEAIVHVAFHPAARAGGRATCFLVGHVTASEIAAIRFGGEGQSWALMPLAAFLNHPQGIPALQHRLRDALARRHAPPRDGEAPSVLSDPEARAGSAGSGAPPADGFAALVPELSVSDLARSLRFWCDVLGFAVLYDRPAAGFAYLARGPVQVMLCQVNERWETGALRRPFGRGLNLQIIVEALAPITDALAAAAWPLFEAPAVVWYRAGQAEVGQRECLVQDPDGYLLRFVAMLGLRHAGP